MNNDIKLLKKEFNKIKNKELNKSLRKGNTGIGYTFETLINKKEDTSFLPDFKSIEIKTKLGYTNKPLTLFCLSPKGATNFITKEILNKYGYPNKNNKKYKSFKGDIYNNKNNIIANRYILKIKIKLEENKLFLHILDTSLNIIDNTIYWNLEELKNRLTTKLKFLAIIKGYPYKRNDIMYYKYTNLTIYKLKNFNTFLSLLEKDIIHITINLDTFTSGKRIGEIHDRGTAFRINLNNIEDLFIKV